MSTPRLLTADVAVPAQCQLAEGPVWDAGRQLLLWIDTQAGEVHSFDPAAGAHGRFGIGGRVGAVGLTESGRKLLLALADGFALCDTDGGRLERLPGPSIDRDTVRFNDGKPDPWGNFWAGTMQHDEGTDGLGCLYRLTPGGEVTELIPGVSLSNGLDWTDDRRRFYYVDSTSGGVDAFDTDPDTGALSNRRRFVEIAAADGLPDGLTLDAEGGIWLAIWDSGQLRRYRPDGTLDTVVSLPVSQVSSACFGGPDLSTLYITTARQGFTEDKLLAEPHAGDIFSCTPGVAGRLPFRFAGPIARQP
jgi:sugar lactone lactonase YvrE